jgi:DNA-binding MarR family transcriptional regulator
MKWEDVGVVKASTIKLEILKLLLNNALTPKDISETIGKHLSQVSRSLKAMEERGIVQCVTPQLRKGRLYTITEKGKDLMEKIAPNEIGRH